MKAVLGLLALLGVVYGLAFVGVIPTKKLAAQSPALGKVLVALHLAKPTPKAAPALAAAPSKAKAAPDPARLQIAAERAQLDKDKAAFAAQQQAALAAPLPSADPAPAPDTQAKLIALYGTMDPDDLAPIFAKLPDPQVISLLVKMDEKKAGAVFAALPPDRAARLSRIMASGSPTRQASAPASAAAAPRPATSL